MNGIHAVAICLAGLDALITGRGDVVARLADDVAKTSGISLGSLHNMSKLASGIILPAEFNVSRRDPSSLEVSWSVGR